MDSQAKTAQGYANKGFSALKDQYDYGVKLHTVVTAKNAAPYTFLLSVW